MQASVTINFVWQMQAAVVAEYGGARGMQQLNIDLPFELEDHDVLIEVHKIVDLLFT